MKSIELFAGVGGFRLGLERAGHEVVFANEWDKYACDTYDKNFGGSIDRRDITTIPATDIPEHDLIVGGFPCQAFSVAGKRRGFADIRGTLFFDIARIAKHHKTPYLLLENVRGLLSHDGGRTFGTILSTLDELGYDCQWQVCNSKDFGVPQNRERVIIVGHTRGLPRPEVFPLGGTVSEASLTQVNQQGRSVAERIYSSDGLSMTLSANGGGGGGKTGLYAVATQGVAELQYVGSLNPVPRKGMEGQEHLSRANKQPARVYDSDGINPALSAGETQGRYHTLHEHRIRRLTPIECERLQGFPDNWTAGVSDTQRYKQMGNAVTVNVIEAVARRLPL